MPRGHDHDDPLDRFQAVITGLCAWMIVISVVTVGLIGVTINLILTVEEQLDSVRPSIQEVESD